jgi:hypothetical protein
MLCSGFRILLLQLPPFIHLRSNGLRMSSFKTRLVALHLLSYTKIDTKEITATFIIPTTEMPMSRGNTEHQLASAPSSFAEAQLEV